MQNFYGPHVTKTLTECVKAVSTIKHFFFSVVVQLSYKQHLLDYIFLDLFTLEKEGSHRNEGCAAKMSV